MVNTGKEVRNTNLSRLSPKADPGEVCLAPGPSFRHFFKLILLTLLFSILLLPEVSGQWLPGYYYRKQITINESQIPAGPPLQDFPVMISIENDDDLKPALNLGILYTAGGDDIRFTASDGTTELEFEIEHWDELTGDLVAWVRIPSLITGTDTDIYLYYGNPLAAPYATPENTWNSSYLGVWHINDNFDDATSNNEDGSSNGPVAAAGIAAGGQSFDGVDDYIELTNIGAPQGTVSFWMKLDNDFSNSTPSSQTLFSKFENNDNHFGIYLHGTDNDQYGNEGKFYFEIEHSSGFPRQVSSTDSWDAGDWHMISGRWGTNHALSC